MRIFFLLVVGVIATLLVLLSFRGCHNKPDSASAVDTESITKTQRANTQIKQENVDSREVVSDPKKVEVWNNLFKSPINFWVKVVDENNQPIEGASVRVKIFKDSSGGGTENMIRELKTNREGLANLLNERGAMIHAIASAEGYKALRGEKGGDLSRSNINYTSDNYVPPQPTQQKPTTLRLRTIHPQAPLYLYNSNRVKIDPNGEEVKLSVVTNDGEHNITVSVKCWSEAPVPFDYSRYPWKAEIQMLGGKLLEMRNKFDYDAPKNGYEPLISVNNEDPHAKNWFRSLSGKRGYYWFKTNDGNYGKILFDLDTGFNHKFSFKGVLNPTGSTILDAEL